MRFAKMTAAAALGLATISGQAHAAKVLTITGTITPSADGNALHSAYFTLPSQAIHFTRSMYISFSAPVTGYAWQDALITYNFFDKYGNIFPSYGNDITGGPWASGVSTRSFRGTYAQPSPWTQKWSCARGPEDETCYKLYWIYSGPLNFSLTGMSAPVDFTASFFQGVPEPATWALMILGFGGIGATMRRRVKHAPAPVAA